MSNKIPYETHCEVYDKALHKWGMVTQMLVAIEEMSELTKELCKLRRLKGRLVDLAEEIADVTIMLEQLRMLYDVNELVCAFMDAKVQRLAKNLEADDGN